MIEPKKILLLGDSNFCGEWIQVPDSYQYNCYWGDKVKSINKLNTLPKKGYQVSHPGLQHYLSLDGHLVVNSAHGGGSNFSNLKVLFENFFMGGGTWATSFTAPDMVIICLTEPLRDLYRLIPYLPDDLGFWDDYLLPIINKSDTPEKLNTNFTRMYFDILQKIYDITNIPIILVEGWGKSLNMLSKYTFCYHLEEKWIDGIIGMKSLYITTIQTYEAVVEHFGKRLNPGRRDRILKHYERFHEKLSKKNIFPDGGHPSHEHHRDLAKKLKPVIDSIPKFILPEINYIEYNKAFRSLI